MEPSAATTTPTSNSTLPVTMATTEASEATAMLLHTPLVTFLVLLVLVGVTGNGLSFFIYHFRWPPSTFTLCVRFLAVLDFLNLALAMSLLGWDVLGGGGGLLLCRLTHGLSFTCNSSTGMIVALIAVQRYRKVVTPWKRAIPLRVAWTFCLVAILLCASASYSYVMTFDHRNFTVTYDSDNTVALHICHMGTLESTQPWSLVSLVASGSGLVVINITLFVTYSAIGVSVVRRRRARARAMMMMSPLFSRPKALRVMVSSAMFLDKGSVVPSIGSSLRQHSRVQRISGVLLRRNETLKKFTDSILSKGTTAEELGEGNEERNRPESTPVTKSLSASSQAPSPCARPATVAVPLQVPAVERRKEPLAKKRSVSAINLHSRPDEFPRVPCPRQSYSHTFPWRRDTAERYSEFPPCSPASGAGRMRRYSSLQALRMLYRRPTSRSRGSRNVSEIFPESEDVSTPQLLRYRPLNRDTSQAAPTSPVAETGHVSSVQDESVVESTPASRDDVVMVTSNENSTSQESVARKILENDVVTAEDEGEGGGDPVSRVCCSGEGSRSAAPPRFASQLTISSKDEDSSSINTCMSEIRDESNSDTVSQTDALFGLHGNDAFLFARHSSFEQASLQQRPSFRRISEPPTFDKKNYSGDFEMAPLLATVVESCNEPRTPTEKLPDGRPSRQSSDNGAASSAKTRKSSDVTATSQSASQWDDLSRRKREEEEGQEEPAVKRRRRSRPAPTPHTPAAVVDLTSQSTRMCLTLTLVYLLSYIPYCVVLTLGYEPDFGQGMSPAHFALFEISFFFLNINNTVNPIIYGLMSRKFREECRKCWAALKASSRCAARH